MIPRAATQLIDRLVAQFPVVVITGPRQSGKTTLVRSRFAEKPYLNLELPDMRQRIIDDPRGTLYPIRATGAVIDEAQRFPELNSWLQGIIDEDPRAGLWILTRSNQPLLRQSATQSLAGRAAFAKLLPFFTDELAATSLFTNASTDECLYRGWYPPLFDRPFIPSDWYAQYVALYLERDLSQLINVKDMREFEKFLALCAGRTGQLLNLSELARDVGISHTTARGWLSILEQSFLAFELAPYSKNFQKRIIKSPKLYFYDCGLAAWLMGIREPRQIMTHPLRGALFETMVVADIIKRASAQGSDARFSFWNAPSVGEIDLIIEEGAAITAIEIKSGTTFHPEMANTLIKWATIAAEPIPQRILVYDGEETFQFKGIEVVPWRIVGRDERHGRDGRHGRDNVSIG